MGSQRTMRRISLLLLPMAMILQSVMQPVATSSCNTTFNISSVVQTQNPLFTISENGGEEIVDIGRVLCSFPGYPNVARYSLSPGLPDCALMCPGRCGLSHSKLCFRVHSTTGSISVAGVNFEGGYTAFSANASVICRLAMCQTTNISVPIRVSIRSSNEFHPERCGGWIGYLHLFAYAYYSETYSISMSDMDNNNTVDGRLYNESVSGDISTFGITVTQSSTRNGLFLLHIPNADIIPQQVIFIRITVYNSFGRPYTCSITLSPKLRSSSAPHYSHPTLSSSVTLDQPGGLPPLLASMACLDAEPFNTTEYIKTEVKANASQSSNLSLFRIESAFHVQQIGNPSRSVNAIKIYLQQVPPKRVTKLSLTLECFSNGTNDRLPQFEHLLKANPSSVLKVDVAHRGLQFTNGTYHGFVHQNMSAGMTVLWVADNPVVECIGQVYCTTWPSYNISFPTNVYPFEINTTTGEIFTTRSITENTTQRFTTQLQLIPSRGYMDTATIIIDVLAGDHHQIEYVGPNVTQPISVSYISAPGTILFSHLFNDSDSSLSQPGCKLLTRHIDMPVSVSNSCQLLITGNLSYYPDKEFILKVLAYDTDLVQPFRQQSVTLSIVVNFTGQLCPQPSVANSVQPTEVRRYYPRNLTLQCMTGFLVRNTSATVLASCLTTGMWMTHGDCLPAFCNTPPSVHAGTILTVSRRFLGVAVYGCNKGFAAAKSSSLTCKTSSNSVGWLGVLPECYDLNECLLNRTACDGAATCTNNPGSYTCQCRGGYTGSPPCTNLNECAQLIFPCDRHAHCTDTDGSFTCKCRHGFTGNGAECRDNDECLSGPCGNFTCLNTPGSYKCHCADGWIPTPDSTGCVDLDECSDTYFSFQICSGYLPCTNTEGAFSCACPAGLRTDRRYLRGRANARLSSCVDIDECNRSACGHHTCRNTYGSYHCLCSKGFTPHHNSTTCVEIDECLNVTCPVSGQVCRDLLGNYQCVCQTGYALSSELCRVRNGAGQCTGLSPKCLDIDECTNSTLNTCGNNKCTNLNGSFACTCTRGYRSAGNSTRCVNDNECTTSMHACPTTYRCVDLPGSYRCDCPEGFENSSSGSGNGVGDIGGSACQDIDECNQTPPICGNANCSNAIGSYACSCGTGFSFSFQSRTCMDVNECMQGTHLCAGVSRCQNTNGTYACSCPSGYALQDKWTCKDIPECLNATACQDNNTDCVELTGSFDCPCKHGYKRENQSSSCTDIDECMIENECSTRAICSNTPGSYHCRCFPGTTGGARNSTCNDVDECNLGLHACGPNTVCINQLATFSCQCAAGFTGRPLVTGCLQDNDECATGTHTCKQDDLCVNTPGSYTCSCHRGFVRSSPASTCQDEDECRLSVPVCGAYSNCNNTIGGYRCKCQTGYSGAYGRNCTDLNECQNATACNSYSVCRNTDGSFLCPCTANSYMNTVTGVCEMDECQTGAHNCKTNSLCRKRNGTFDCECISGYEGNPRTGCHDKNECNLHLCPELTTCKNSDGSYSCSCNEGYVLSEDQGKCSDNNECSAKSHNCHKNASCYNAIGFFTCQCNNGFQGNGYVCYSLHVVTTETSTTQAPRETVGPTSAAPSFFSRPEVVAGTVAGICILVFFVFEAIKFAGAKKKKRKAGDFNTGQRREPRDTNTYVDNESRLSNYTIVEMSDQCGSKLSVACDATGPRYSRGSSTSNAYQGNSYKQPHINVQEVPGIVYFDDDDTGGAIYQEAGLSSHTMNSWRQESSCSQAYSNTFCEDNYGVDYLNRIRSNGNDAIYDFEESDDEDIPYDEAFSTDPAEEFTNVGYSAFVRNRDSSTSVRKPRSPLQSTPSMAASADGSSYEAWGNRKNGPRYATPWDGQAESGASKASQTAWDKKVPPKRSLPRRAVSLHGSQDRRGHPHKNRLAGHSASVRRPSSRPTGSSLSSTNRQQQSMRSTRGIKGSTSVDANRRDIGPSGSPSKLVETMGSGWQYDDVYVGVGETDMFEDDGLYGHGSYGSVSPVFPHPKSVLTESLARHERHGTIIVSPTNYSPL